MQDHEIYTADGALNMAVIEERARQLRAEAARDAIAAFFGMFRSQPHEKKAFQRA